MLTSLFYDFDNNVGIILSCDDGWEGDFCQTPVSKLPSSLKENFDPITGKTSTSKFQQVVGGQIDDSCGKIGFGKALHFNQVFILKIYVVAFQKFILILIKFCILKPFLLIAKFS